MKKKILLIIIAVMCSVFGLVGCDMGAYIENGGKPVGPVVDPEKPEKPGDSEDPEKPDPAVSKDYTATVYLNKKPFDPGDNEITVVWQNGNDVHRAPLGADGKANAGELDGDYGVYLVGLPTTYTYDPNAGTATAKERSVDIELTTLRSPSGGDGSNMYSGLGCYTTRYDGTYRAEIKSDGSKVYYEYQPMSSGVYSVVSWVNVYADEIDPAVEYYPGSSQFKYYERTIKDGGAALDGGFTKNFRFECLIDQSEIGGVFTFAITARSKTAQYPVYVDFAITWEGDYKNGYNDVRPQKATEANVKAANSNRPFNSADLNTKVFDADNFKYNANTGFYHYYSMELFGDDPYGNGVGFGPELCCSITPSVSCYTITTLYNANSVGTNSSNYLKLYNVWLEAENKYCTYDYTDFIRVDYYAVCNKDGRCYVTEELKVFLQKFAENHSLYTDGVGPGSGTPEALGYSANQDALWLFACGFYM
ncbi:MAG: hypothetical protein K2M48_01825 [Clostridiales bacterium]|nr:hypothetical protein [Clostridiales bacterium]